MAHESDKTKLQELEEKLSELEARCKYEDQKSQVAGFDGSRKRAS
jgi:BMFP domain-containing protein YqiC